ncbi:MAG: YgiQ family radical SAM protein [Bdellovibrionales bacterium]|nr:YgiQ family radical SAM protein [Bdellovibrionales bacterium]
MPQTMNAKPGSPITNEIVYREACKRFLPTTRQEMKWKNYDELDVLLINGDAYVDHPTFGIACLGRWLERMGLRVGIISQPHWTTVEDVQRMGRPRLFVGVSSGTVDSMINNYTANKKRRSDDMYSEGGRGKRRPDYASIVYCELAKKAFPETPVVVGGVEVSLRRLAHYDYWQNRVRPSILTELAAEFLVFGMGERSTSIMVEEFRKAEAAVGGPLSLSQPETQAAIANIKKNRGIAFVASKEEARTLEGRLTIPSYEEVRDDKKKFAKAAYFIEYEASPYNGRRLIQYHGSKAVVINPPALPLDTEELDSIYELPFTKEQHPSYKERIPAADMIRFSVASTRGCFGGCSFCAITLHQGRIVQSRSEESILNEVAKLPTVPGFKGIVSDIGGPTANMYTLRCKSKEIQSQCRKLSCVHPRVCPHLHTDHTPQVKMLEKARKLPGIRKIHIASGLRYDLAFADQKSGKQYLKDLIGHHVGGHLKVAPEHMDDEVLHLMKKPGLKNFDQFVSYFKEVSDEVGKEQYVVPYFISGFPGTTHDKMEKVYDYLREKGWNLQQVQAFIPTPMTLATAMYWTGIDPMSKKPLFVAKNWDDRKIQQALLQPHKPEHREVLMKYRQALAKQKYAKPGSIGVGAAAVGDQKGKGPSEAHTASAKGPSLKKSSRTIAGRSIVNPPPHKMGKKLLLDSR